ncbi:MAG: hypothetical protein R3E66_22595 [bacterium]
MKKRKSEWSGRWVVALEDIWLTTQNIARTDYLSVNNVVAVFAGAEALSGHAEYWLGTSCVRKRAPGAYARRQAVCLLRSTVNGARH